MAKTYDVKYNGIFGPKYRHYEDFEISGNKVRVAFDRDTGIAKNVPEQIAVKLHKSEAFDIVGPDGKVPKEFLENASPYSAQTTFPTDDGNKEETPNTPAVGASTKGRKQKGE